MQLIRYNRSSEKTEQPRGFIEKVRLAGDLEPSSDSDNKQDGEDTLESRWCLNGFWSEEGRG